MPHIQTLELNSEYAKFILEPLEKGYGQTVGNALRRVLLSSVPGAAVTAVKIDKVLHEFSAIPGVKEDATEFLLNVKDLSIRVSSTVEDYNNIVLHIDAKGPGKVTGADVVCPEGVEIVNPDCYLATMSDESSQFVCELYASIGMGYVLPDKHEQHRDIIGVLAVGSQFTPVRKVNYIVEQTRVGTQTDYERLIMEVFTNGSVFPNDAMTQSAQILDRYIKMFLDLGVTSFALELEEEEQEATDLSSIPDLKLDELNFSQRTFNCLRRASLMNLRAIAQVSETDLIAIRGFGKKSLYEVVAKLDEFGLYIKPPTGGYRVIDMNEAAQYAADSGAEDNSTDESTDENAVEESLE